MEKKIDSQTEKAERQKKAIEKLSPFLQKQFEALFVHHDQIEQLFKKDPKEKELFRRSPLEFFKKHRMEVPAFLEKKLNLFNYENLEKKEQVILPNGQVIDSITNINLVI